MAAPSFWDRLRETRLVQTLVVYLAGAWIALQVVALFSDAFDWSTWVMRASIVALAVGLVITLLAVWAHGKARRAAETADEAVPSGRRPLVAAVTAACLLLVGGALWVIVEDRGRSFAPEEAVAEAAAPGVAILPFRVNSDAIEEWREGMVDLLSISLDDLPGLRAIDSRTTLASWRDRVGEAREPDLESALAVARAIGARWAVVGNAVANGPNVRLLAEVYDLEDGSRSLGERQLDGAQDSMFSLVNRLTVEVVGLMAEGGVAEIPPIDLASVTTSSLPALKAFLAGEAAFRRADYESAIPAYVEAVETDTTFALAHYRLGDAYGWIESLQGEHVLEEYRAAERFADRLPRRDATLLEVSLGYATSRPEATTLAEAAAERYPDDPQASFLLGEVRFHLPNQSLPTPEEKRAPFGEAVRLDPAYTPAYLHLLDLAFLEADTARVDSLLVAFRQHGAGTTYDEMFSLAYAAAFTDTLPAATVAERLSSRPTVFTGHVMTLLSNPRFWDRQGRIGEYLLRDPDSRAIDYLPQALMARGEIDSLAAAADAGSIPRVAAVGALLFAEQAGARVPEATLDRLLAPADTARGGVLVASAALRALEDGDPGPARKVARETRAAADSTLGAGDSTAARQLTAIALSLEGRDAMLAGRDREALEKLERAYRIAPFPPVAMWAAELEREAGDPERAVRYLVQLAPLPWVGQELGSLYEELGEPEKAREAYAWVVEGWRHADPFLQPRVVEARGALARLEGLRRG